MVKKIINNSRTPTIKQQRFIEAVIETGNKAEAARRAGYKCKNNVEAAKAGYETSIKPYIKVAIDERIKNAKAMIYKLSQESKKDEVRIKACQDIIDRAEGKAIARTEIGGKDGGPITITRGL